MNYKGVLQEYYAYDGVLPKYSTTLIPGNASNNPKWKVILEVPDGTFTVEGRGKKKLIEQKAAQQAYESIHKCESIHIYDNVNPTITSSSVILVDIENQANIYKYAKELPRNIPIIIVGSLDSPVLEIVRKELPFVIIQEVPSTRVNAADIGLCMIVTKYLLENTYNHIIILSNDKFSGVVVDCVNHNFICDSKSIKIEWYRTVKNMLKNI